MALARKSNTKRFSIFQIIRLNIGIGKIDASIRIHLSGNGKTGKIVTLMIASVEQERINRIVLVSCPDLGFAGSAECINPQFVQRCPKLQQSLILVISVGEMPGSVFRLLGKLKFRGQDL